VVGTWTGRGQPDDRPFTFGSVSFVGDHTFTAEARYGGDIRVQSGPWTASDNELHLAAGDTRRQYTYRVEADELIVTDPQSGESMTLDRLGRSRRSGNGRRRGRPCPRAPGFVARKVSTASRGRRRPRRGQPQEPSDV